MASLNFNVWAIVTSFFIPFHFNYSQASPPHDQYVIFMDSSAMPRAYSSPYHWHLATLSSASKLIYSYSHVIDGFCATLTPWELSSIRDSPGFLHSVEDSPVLKYDTTHSAQFLGLNGGPSGAWEAHSAQFSGPSGAWEASSYGEGMIIGVVDTGVWPESRSYDDVGMSPAPAKWRGRCENGPRFNASCSCNNKLIGARVFNKGLIARNITPPLYDSPRDAEGHGTHTSSTAAGRFVRGASYFGYAPGTAKGVAPKAHVAMYKALLGDPHSSHCDVVAAIDAAVADGVDVLSLSFGFDNVSIHQDPVALATFAAAERNVFVAASAGNAGAGPKSLHNGIPWVLTVAAGTMDRQFQGRVELGNGSVSVSGSSLHPRSNAATPAAPVIYIADCAEATL